MQCLLLDFTFTISFRFIFVVNILPCMVLKVNLSIFFYKMNSQWNCLSLIIKSVTQLPYMHIISEAVADIVKTNK